MAQIVGYILKSKKTGKWIKVDDRSGGYPYEVEAIERAQLFITQTEAERYNAVMSWKDYDNPLYTVHEVQMEATLVESRTGDQLRAFRDHPKGLM